MNKRKFSITILVIILTISIGIVGCSNSSHEDEYQIPESVVNEDVIDTSDSADEQPEDIETKTIDTLPADSNAENDTSQNNTKELADLIENTESTEEIISTIDNYNGLTTLDISEAIVDTVEPEEPVDEEADSENQNTSTNTVRTDAEIKATIKEFADNFKNTPAFDNLTGEGLEYVDECLEILRNNPESDDSIKTYANFYKEGLFTEEMFISSLQSWVEIAGPFGSGKIVVH